MNRKGQTTKENQIPGGRNISLHVARDVVETRRREEANQPSLTVWSSRNSMGGISRFEGAGPRRMRPTRRQKKTQQEGAVRKCTYTDTETAREGECGDGQTRRRTLTFLDETSVLKDISKGSHEDFSLLPVNLRSLSLSADTAYVQEKTSDCTR